MLPDVLSVVIRALGFVCALQAAGVVIFRELFAPRIADVQTNRGFRQLSLWSAWAAIALVLAHYALEPARMAGELSGIWDVSLQKLVATSSTALADGLRIVGLLLVAFAVRSAARQSAPAAWIGALMVAASFATTGHTASHANRWALAGLLFVHLLVIEFWFGALLPMISLARRGPQVAARPVRLFSRIATALVPLILVAGLGMALLLIPDLTVLREPYGQLLLAKGAGFATLLALAAVNKWMLGPSLDAGDIHAARRFQRSAAAEYALIVIVLVLTAVMTSFFSPEA